MESYASADIGGKCVMVWGGLQHYSKSYCSIPTSTDALALSAFNKKDIKARRIILDAVKDHVIPHISSKTRAYQM